MVDSQANTLVFWSSIVCRVLGGFMVLQTLALISYTDRLKRLVARSIFWSDVLQVIALHACRYLRAFSCCCDTTLSTTSKTLRLSPGDAIIRVRKPESGCPYRFSYDRLPLLRRRECIQAALLLR